MNSTSSKLIGAALVLVATGGVFAQDPPAEPTGNLFTQQLPQVIADGKLHLNARLRYEYAEQSNLREANALTLRTRLGYETAPVYGFKGMAEFEDIRALVNRRNYAVPGLHGTGHTVIADPQVIELNQAWLSYSNWDSTAKVGRQRIVLDNHRFIGNVGWRQNEQTYDAVFAQNKSLPDTTLTYGYLHRVNRVFGDLNGLPAGLRDFQSDSHIIHAAYGGCPYGTLTGYGYLLDFDNSPANSAATYGGSFAGGHTFDKETNTKLNYRAEYARQMDYGNQPANYGANYYNLELGGDYQRFNAGGGAEVLGSDGGATGFSTPLATLHAFNGWADVFLATPPAGLRDLYGWAGVNLPGNIPLRAVYHKFDSDSGSTNFGQEVDVVASRRFGKHWTLLTKYSWYDGKAPVGALPTNTTIHKFWFQAEFNF